MEEIGGKSESVAQEAGRCHLGYRLYSYCHQLIERNMWGLFMCSCAKAWETAQVAYIIYLFFEAKTRNASYQEPLWAGFFNIRVLLEYGSSILSMACECAMYVNIMLIPLGFLLQLLVSRFRLTFLRQTYKVVTTMASVMLLSLCGPIAIPALIILLGVFECHLSLDAGLISGTCWQSMHIAIALTNGLLLCLLLTMFVLAALFVYDDFFHSSFPYSGPQNYSRLLCYADKLILAGACVFDYGGANMTALFAGVLAVKCIQVYLHLTQPSMWHSLFHDAIIFCDGFIVPYLVFFFLNYWLLDIDVSALIFCIVILGSAAVALLFVFVKVALNNQCLYNKTDQARSADSWLLYLYMLLQLFIQEKTSDDARVKLVGVLSAYQEQCRDEECRCTSYDLVRTMRRTLSRLKSTHSVSEERPLQTVHSEDAGPQFRNKEELYARIIHEIIKTALRQYPRHIDLKLLASYFLKGVLNNPYKSAYELAAVSGMRPNLLKSFAIYRYKKLIENDIKKEYRRSLENGGSTISVENAVQMERIYYLFRKLMEDTATTAVEFLNCVKEENLNGDRMEALAGKIGLQNSELALMFESFIKSYPFHCRILSDYGKYLQMVLNGEAEAGQLFTKAQDIMRRVREERVAASSGHVDLQDLSRNSRVAVLVVSANAGKMGTILNCNNEVYENFGHETRQLVNCNISTLMPGYMLRPHSELIDKYLSEYKGLGAEAASANLLRLCTNARGYLIPCRVQYRFYPNLDRGLLFVVFAQRIDRLLPLLPIKGNIKESDVGIITCAQDGTLLGLTESICNNYGIPASAILASARLDSSTQRRLSIEDVLVGLTLEDCKTQSKILKVKVSNSRVRALVECEDLQQEPEAAKKFDEVLHPAFAVIENKAYPGLNLYQITVVSMSEQGSDGKLKKHRDLGKEAVDDLFKADIESTNTSSSTDDSKRYVPLLKTLKESVRTHDSPKVKIMTRVGVGLAVVLFALNTAAMVISSNSIGLSQDRVLIVDDCWNRVVELANLNMYLTSMMNIASGIESDSIHDLDGSSDNSTGRFAKIRVKYAESLEKLRTLQNGLQKKDTNFTGELRHYVQDTVMVTSRLSAWGVVYTENLTFTMAIAQLITKGVEFANYSQANFLANIRSADYNSLFNKSINLNERDFFYIRWNTLNYYRNVSVTFSLLMEQYSADAASSQLATIIVFAGVSVLLIVIAGVVMIYIIINIKSTRLLVLAFYAQTPRIILSQMTEGTIGFLNALETNTRDPEGDHSTPGAKCTPVPAPGKSETPAEAKAEMSPQKEHKVDESRIELLDKKPERKDGEESRSEDEEGVKKEETPAEAALSPSKLQEIVSTKFTASVKSQRWYIACLIMMFVLLFGLYTAFNVGLYWVSVNVAKSSFGYTDGYLRLYSALANSMSLYDNFLVSQKAQATYDHDDALDFYVQRTRDRLLDVISLKRQDSSWLIGKVVKLQNALDTSDGICDLYAGNNKELFNICSEDYSSLMAIGLTSLMSRTLDEISTQYGKFTTSNSTFSFSDAKGRFDQLLRVKEEYVNMCTSDIRETLREELESCFGVLNVVSKAVYACWVVIMVTAYFLCIRFLSLSLNKDILRSNNILNMLPMDYLLAIVKDKAGVDLIKQIFL